MTEHLPIRRTTISESTGRPALAKFCWLLSCLRSAQQDLSCHPERTGPQALFGVPKERFCSLGPSLGVVSRRTRICFSKSFGDTGRPTFAIRRSGLLSLGRPRIHFPRSLLLSSILTALLFSLAPAFSSAQSPVVLDSVVAIVNRHAILASDIDDEIHLSVLDPSRAGQGELTPKRALDQLISQALIQQQIRREDAQAVEPSDAEVNARLAEIRKELPECVHQNCASDAGWKAFLVGHDLTPERVDAYLRFRLEILSFIEQRFRPGIHISPQEIESYYRNTLQPLYGPGEAVPTLERVSPRIEEILLQQQVNVLFDDWLTNLRKQGDVEILDPALESAESSATSPAAPRNSQNRPPSGAGKGGAQ